MFVLAIDTSSPAVTAGIVTVDGDAALVALVAERAPLAARGHGELLTPAIDDCLQSAGLSPADIGAVVAGTGPGPYTGLRVGLVTAAAFADALGVPAFGVCSLDVLGLAAGDEPDLLVATDARRHEVYWARYRHGVRTQGPEVARPADVPLDGLRAVAGAGGELYADVWPQLQRRTERYPDPVSLVRCAGNVFMSAEKAAESARITTSSADMNRSLAPMYLRRPDAVVPGAPKTVSQAVR